MLLEIKNIIEGEVWWYILTSWLGRQNQEDQAFRTSLGHTRFYLKKLKQLSFQLGSTRKFPAKKHVEKKKGCSSIKEVVMLEYTMDIRKSIHEWPSGCVPLRHSEKSATLPQRLLGLQKCTLIRGSTKLPRLEQQGVFHIVSMCTCPENLIRMRVHQASYILW